jgi:hypothetical protein
MAVLEVIVDIDYFVGSGCKDSGKAYVLSGSDYSETRQERAFPARSAVDYLVDTLVR